MSRQQQESVSLVNDATIPRWLRLCRWLWRFTGFLGVSVVLALGINIVSSLLTTSKGVFPDDAPFSLLTKHWLISLLVSCCLLLLATIFWAISRWSVPRRSFTLQDRMHMLRRLRLRYEQMISQSLQGAVQMELGLATRPTAIHNAASLALRLPEQAEQALPSHTSIVDAYEQAQQELLILGEPGTGKSTLLLELAYYLVKQAELDTGQPLPVLLPLSSWANKRPLLQEWIIEQFALLYNVPCKFSQQWLEMKLILPLLDGLDEMEASARPACIKAINAYHREHLHPLVVCSRTTEYDSFAQQEQLELHTAVVVQLLSKEQTDAYLATLGKPLAALRTALKKMSALAELATTPLMLQILILTYYGTTVRQLSQKAEELQQQIWTAYVHRMVERKGDGQRYSLDRTISWLCWLARQMRDHNQTVFFMELLAPNWLSRRHQLFYHLSILLVICSVLEPIAWLVGWQVTLMACGLFGCIQLAPILAWSWKTAQLNLTVRLLSEGKIQMKDIGTGSWNMSQLGLISRLAFGLSPQKLGGLLAGLSGGLLVGLIFWLRNGLLAGLIFGLLSGLFAGLVGGSLTNELTKQIYRLWYYDSLNRLISANRPPKQVHQLLDEGLQPSLKNRLLTGLIIGLFIGLIIGLLYGPSNGLLAGLITWMTSGFHSKIKHSILRLWLWKTQVFPRNAAAFLEDAADRILLRRVGGGYSFTHRLLLEYFADLDTTPPSVTPYDASNTTGF